MLKKVFKRNAMGKAQKCTSGFLLSKTMKLSKLPLTKHQTNFSTLLDDQLVVISKILTGIIIIELDSVSFKRRFGKNNVSAKLMP